MIEQGYYEAYKSYRQGTLEKDVPKYIQKQYEIELWDKKHE